MEMEITVLFSSFLLFLALFQDSFAIDEAAQGCKFSDSWKGRWEHEHSDFTFAIDEHSIYETMNHKDANDVFGSCSAKHEKNKDLYLITKPDPDTLIKCTKCYYIEELHRNVLTYRVGSSASSGYGSECVEDLPKYNGKQAVIRNLEFGPEEEQFCKETLQSSEFHYMFRSTGRTLVPCPFGGRPFHFSYGRPKESSADLEKVCSNKNSHLESCYDSNQMVLKYEACRDQDFAQSKVEELACLASWTDSGKNYLIAEVKENDQFVGGKYRCFMYEEIVNKQDAIRRRIQPSLPVGYNVSVSATASCGPLAALSDGVLSLTLYLPVDEDKKPVAQCKFPNWFARSGWKSLNSRQNFWAAPDPSEILFNDTLTPSVLKHFGKYSCRKSVSNGEAEVRILGKQIEGCSMKDVCINLSRLSTSVSRISIRVRENNEVFTNEDFESLCLIGKISEHSETEIITLDAFHSKALTTTLISTTTQSPTSVCPFKGTFELEGFFTGEERDCDSDNVLSRHPNQLLAGCEDETKLTLKDSCEWDKAPVATKCMSSWTTENISYFLLSVPTKADNDVTIAELNKHYCFHYSYSSQEEPSDVVIEGYSNRCKLDERREEYEQDPVSFTMKREGSCQMKTEPLSGDELEEDDLLRMESKGSRSRLALELSLALVMVSAVTNLCSFNDY